VFSLPDLPVFLTFTEQIEREQSNPPALKSCGLPATVEALAENTRDKLAFFAVS